MPPPEGTLSTPRGERTGRSRLRAPVYTRGSLRAETVQQERVGVLVRQRER